MSLSRRGFLQLVGAGTLAVALPGGVEALVEARPMAPHVPGGVDCLPFRSYPYPYLIRMPMTPVGSDLQIVRTLPVVLRSPLLPWATCRARHLEFRTAHEDPRQEPSMCLVGSNLVIGPLDSALFVDPSHTGMHAAGSLPAGSRAQVELDGDLRGEGGFLIATLIVEVGDDTVTAGPRGVPTWEHPN